MKKSLYLSLLFTGAMMIISTGFTYGQNSAEVPDGTSIIPSSPNAAALGEYSSIPVSAYTGVPNINIPICEVVSGDIKVPISISYHASGIKVGEV